MAEENPFKIPRPRRIKLRIMGVENELGGRVVNKDGFPLPSGSGVFENHCGEIILAMVPKNMSNRCLQYARVALPNGSLCYSDTGSHLEHSTSECLGARELSLFETAGMEVIADGMRRYNQAKSGPYVMSLHKANRSCELDDLGQPLKYSWGSHANFLSFRRVEDGLRMQQMAGFLISRWPLIGNGWFKVVDKKYLRFIFSQRGEVVEAKVDGCTTGEAKPLINTKDKSMLGSEIWRRIHDISGNHNMSQVQLVLKYGTFDLLLAMVEAGDFLQPPPLPVDLKKIPFPGEYASYTLASHIFNNDIRCKTPVPLKNGREWTSLDFQRYYLNEARRFFAKGLGTLTPERKWVLELWGKTLDALRRWDLPFLAQYLDWASTLYYEIMPRLKRLGFDPELLFSNSSFLHDPESCAPPRIPHDHQFMRNGKTEMLLKYLLYFLTSYADVDTSSSIYGLYLRQGLIKQIFTREEIEFAKNNPPQRTRARLREELIRNPPKGMILYQFAWDRVTFAPPGTTKGLMVELPNPYRYNMRDGGEEYKPSVNYYDGGCYGG